MTEIDPDTLFNYVEANNAQELQDSLKDEKVDPNCTNAEGWNLLHLACKLSTLKCVKVLTKAPLTKVNSVGPGRLIPLFLAMQYDKMSCFTTLQEHPDINHKFQNQEGQTIIQFTKSLFKSRYGKDVVDHAKRLSTFLVTNHA